MPRRTVGGELQAVFFIFLALASFGAGFASIGQARYFDAESTAAGHRFKDDNAVGATANAVEHLAKTPPSHSAAPWFIAGLLCVLILKVDGLRWTLDRRT
jgi:hypothetical protein